MHTQSLSADSATAALERKSLKSQIYWFGDADDEDDEANRLTLGEWLACSVAG